MPNLLKTFQDCQHYEDTNIHGHPSSYKTLLCQNHSSTFVYGPILIKICSNADIMKTQYMT